MALYVKILHKLFPDKHKCIKIGDPMEKIQKNHERKGKTNTNPNTNPTEKNKPKQIIN